MPKNLTPAGGWAENVAVPVDADPRNAASVEVPFQALVDRNDFLRALLRDDAAASVYLDPRSAGQSGDWLPVGVGSIQSQSNNASLWFDLAAYLPNGARITNIQVLIDEGAARASGSRAALRLAQKSIDWASVTPPISEAELGYSESAGGSGVHYIVIAAGNAGPSWSPVTIDKSQGNYSLRIQAGSDGGAHAPDTVHGIRVLYEAPEARR